MIMSEKTTLHERALDDAAREVVLERWRGYRTPLWFWQEAET
jgi:hypothetical protein